jgi:hypothetical protein
MLKWLLEGLGTTFNDSLGVDVCLLLFGGWRLRSDLRHRDTIIVCFDFLNGMFVVDREHSLNHRHFFVVLTKFSIEVIIVNFVEERDVLLELLSKSSFGNVHEVLPVEGDGSDSCIEIVVQSGAGLTVWTHRNIFSDQSYHRLRIGCKLVREFEGCP